MKRYFFMHAIVLGGLAGIYIARFSPLSSSFMLALAMIAGGFAVRFPRAVLIAPCLFGVWLGMARSEPVLSGYEKLAALQGSKVTIDATIKTDPVYHDSGQYEFNTDNLVVTGEPIEAELRIRGFVNDVRRGDRIVVSGTLRDGFASWQGSLYYADIEIVEGDTSMLYAYRQRFIGAIYSSLPDPEASLGLGFLMGVRTLLPEDLEEQLKTTGLTHIVAVSGYNLTILANTSKRMLHRFSRFQAVLGTLALLLMFVTVTGLSPSIMRATIVSLLSLGAWYYGRSISPWTLLLYSSSISAFMHPVYAWSSIGWYLSLAAFFGVLVLAPLLKQRLIGDAQPKLYTQIVLESSMAQLTTLPIILLVFGEVSLIALLANVAVLPFIPIAMVATFAIGLAYVIHVQLAGMLSYFGYIILNYISSVIEFLSRVEWSLVPFSIELHQFILLVLCIAILWLSLRRSVRV